MITYQNEEYQFITMNWNWGKGCDNPRELEIGRTIHWAYLSIESQKDLDYFLTERVDEEKKTYWRHYEFLAVPCAYCGVYSPLRAQFSLSLTPKGSKNQKKSYRPKYFDYHPADEWPEDILTTSENGWNYTFFRDTLSDSRFGQETFRVSPKVLESVV